MTTRGPVVRYRARRVLPIPREPFADGVVAVADGRIIYVGPPGGGPMGDEVNLGDVALLPGLVNVHTHLELTAFRGLLEDLPFQRWISTLTRARRAVMTSESMLDAARLGVAEGLIAGITTYADTSESGIVVDALSAGGVRGIVFQEVFGPDPAQRERSLAELQRKVGALRERQSPLVRVGVSPHAVYSVSEALFTATCDWAADERLPVAIHAAESEDEDRFVVDGTGLFADALRARHIEVRALGVSPLAYLERAGALRPHTLLIHCVRADRDDVERVRQAGCAVAHCPASNAKLGHGVAPVLAFLGAGVRVGLGSDSVASNNRMDILGEARLAVLTQRAERRDHGVLTAGRALSLATLEGAAALGLDAEIGSLDVGKQADLAAFPLQDAGGGEELDVEAALVHAVAGRSARFVCVAGVPRVRDSRLVDEDGGLLGRVRETTRGLARWREALGGAR
ncbi:MAG TPA: amidohydrolase family protein [Gemmatimonadaceae bacterium]|nr:amidohydrolase family protein [Gemmatimonadaceae bacterium]